jgi:hypothetical protein
VKLSWQALVRAKLGWQAASHCAAECLSAACCNNAHLPLVLVLAWGWR